MSATNLTWTGQLLHIYTATSAGETMTPLQDVQAIAGVGLGGDRYATGQGRYSDRPHENRQVTLIEAEVLDALQRDHNIELRPEETRRNLITQGVPLNHLVGKEFQVGDVTLYGGRLNVPCTYLEKVVDKPVFKPLINRSGLNCQILTGGTIRTGDPITPA
jgi:MOSC domain-containing protein YiiM